MKQVKKYLKFFKLIIEVSGYEEVTHFKVESLQMVEFGYK